MSLQEHQQCVRGGRTYITVTDTPVKCSVVGTGLLEDALIELLLPLVELDAVVEAGKGKPELTHLVNDLAKVETGCFLEVFARKVPARIL